MGYCSSNCYWSANRDWNCSGEREKQGKRERNIRFEQIPDDVEMHCSEFFLC